LIWFCTCVFFMLCSLPIQHVCLASYLLRWREFSILFSWWGVILSVSNELCLWLEEIVSAIESLFWFLLCKSYGCRYHQKGFMSLVQKFYLILRKNGILFYKSGGLHSSLRYLKKAMDSLMLNLNITRFCSYLVVISLPHKHLLKW